MKEHIKQVQAALFLSLAVFATVTYLNFVNFKPAVTVTPEVQGESSAQALGLPFPEGSEQISSDKMAEGIQITLSAALSPEEVQEFYYNVFVSKGWEVESKGEAGVFLTSKFKQQDNPRQVTITSSRQEEFGTTAVIIDVSNY